MTSIRFLLLLFLAVLARAQPRGKSCNDTFKPSPNILQTTFGFRTDGPIRETMKNDLDFVQGVENIVNYLEKLEREILDRDATNKDDSDDELLNVCNFRRLDWRGSVNNWFGFRGFFQPDMSCITDFEGTRTRRDQPELISRNDLHDAILLPALQLQKNARTIVDRTVMNWTQPFVVRSSPAESGSARCTVEAQGAVKVNNLWYTVVFLQSTPRDQFSPNFGRQVLVELLRAEGGTLLAPLNVCVPTRPKRDEERQYRNDYTTVLGSFRGRANAGTFFSSGTILDNLAFQAAVSEADVFLQQADDATTPSNIAILMLPLALNMVPIALVADVSTAMLLAYALLSDVLTVIPLGIKGVELIIIGNQVVTESVTRMSSSISSPPSNTSAVELWVAKCQAKSGIKQTGIVFLVLAIVFLVGGVAAEFLARDFAARRRARRREALLQRERVIPGAENAYLRSTSLIERVFSGSSSRAEASEALLPVDDGMDGDKLS